MRNIKKFLFTNTSTRQTLAKNTFWLFLSEFISRILKMVLVVYAARILGTEGWGSFSYALSLGSLIMIASDIGLNGIITREIIQKKDSHISFVSTAIVLKLLLVLLSTAGVVLIGPYIAHVPSAIPLLPLIAITLCFDVLRDFVLYLNTAFEKMERDMIVKSILGITTIGLGILLLIHQPTTRSIAIAYAVGSFLGCTLAIVLIWKDVRKLITNIERTLVKKIIITTVPFAIISLITTIMANTDIYLLGIWRSPNEIGLYASAQRMYQFILLIPVTIATALFPLQSRLAVDNHEKSANILGKSTAIMCMIALPLSAGGIMVSEKLIVLFFGTNFLGAASILQILLLMLIASFPLTLFSNSVIAHNRQGKLAAIYSIGVATNIFGNIALIPFFGAVGSALATLVSTSIITVLVWHNLYRINRFTVWSRLANVYIALLVMVVLLFFIQKMNAPFIIEIIVATTTYIGVLLFRKEPLIMELYTGVKQKVFS